jgi:hypothetical protein
MEGDYRMTRDEHRAPGRLVPLRPGQGRGKVVPGPTRRHPHTGPFRQDTDYPESDEAPDDEFPFPPAPGHTPPVVDWDARRGMHDDPGAMQSSAREWDDGHAAALPADPEPEVPVRQRSDRMDAAFELQELSTKERHQLLMHTIQLYDDRWKLAGVRANERKNRLEAYLVPRNKQVELKEAMSRNQALIIYIDSRGNTDVREPKKRSLLHRFLTWLFGA